VVLQRFGIIALLGKHNPDAAVGFGQTFLNALFVFGIRLQLIFKDTLRAQNVATLYHNRPE
jgi:hypothetical protein